MSHEIGKLADTGSVDNDCFIQKHCNTELASSGVPHPGDSMVTAVGTLGNEAGRTATVLLERDASALCSGELWPN